MPTSSEAQNEEPHAWPLGLRAAHWTLAFSVVVAAGLAIYLVNPPDWSDAYVQRYFRGIEIHKLLGVAAFIAALALVAQHSLRPPRKGSRLEQRLAALVQSALIFLALAAPTTGYVANALYGGSINIPGFAPIPSPLPRNDKLSSIFTWAHDIGAYILLSLVCLHVLAALRHQVLRKNPVISAMLGFSANARKKAKA